MEIYNQLEEIFDRRGVFANEPLSKHTTFKIGGVADFFVTPRDIPSLRLVISLCKQNDLPYYIIGNGSNLLVGDKGFRGVIIQIFNPISQVELVGDCILVEAGALLSKIANIALKHQLKGFEFAAGIPGTFGGAVMMNAGAYGSEMKGVIQSVRVLDEDGEIRTLSVDELELGYRTSILKTKPYLVIDGILRLEKGSRKEIFDLMENYNGRRVSKQPLELPSAGSTFKRPKGHYAGKLIADAGLGGLRVGDAQVSEKHCGFIVNRGNATAADVVALMRQITERVEKEYGVLLEPEVKFIGEF